MPKLSEKNVSKVLKDDGVIKFDLKSFSNLNKISISKLKKKFGNQSWAARVVYNKRFGGVLIFQKPGEGNRKHYHPDADECWVIIEGKWKWYIEGVGVKTVKKNDIIVVPKKTPHQITCIGNKPGLRFAITKPDVKHVYVD